LFSNLEEGIIVIKNNIIHFANQIFENIITNIHIP